MGEGVNHIVKRGEVQIVQAVQSLRFVPIVANVHRMKAKDGPIEGRGLLARLPGVT
jgi:hypothetical protein